MTPNYRNWARALKLSAATIATAANVPENKVFAWQRGAAIKAETCAKINDAVAKFYQDATTKDA